MEYIIASITTNVAISTVSTITSASNGLFTLVSNVSKSTNTGAEEVISLILRRDLEMKVKLIQYVLCELYINHINSDSTVTADKVNQNIPYSIQYCAKKIHDAIKDVSDELSQVNYRLQYNSSLWFGSALRSYGFTSCKKRLDYKISILEDRYNMLKELLSFQNKLICNKDISTLVDESMLSIDKMRPEFTKCVTNDIHRKIEYINKTDKTDPTLTITL